MFCHLGQVDEGKQNSCIQGGSILHGNMQYMNGFWNINVHTFWTSSVQKFFLRGQLIFSFFVISIITRPVNKLLHWLDAVDSLNVHLCFTGFYWYSLRLVILKNIFSGAWVHDSEGGNHYRALIRKQGSNKPYNPHSNRTGFTGEREGQGNLMSVTLLKRPKDWNEALSEVAIQTVRYSLSLSIMTPILSMGINMSVR